MKWYHSPYFSDSVRKKYPQLQEQMEEGTFPAKVWVIMRSPNGVDLLDIRRAPSLGAHGLWNLVPLMVGAACSKGEALTLVEKIMQDCLEQTGGTDLGAFLGNG